MGEDKDKRVLLQRKKKPKSNTTQSRPYKRQRGSCPSFRDGGRKGKNTSAITSRRVGNMSVTVRSKREIRKISSGQGPHTRPWQVSAIPPSLTSRSAGGGEVWGGGEI